MNPSRRRHPRFGSGAEAGVGLAVVGVALGSVVMLVGTFLPWLASGAQLRNLYGAAGVVQRIAELGQPIGYVLDAVPLAGLFLVLCGALWMVGRRVTAGIAITGVTVLLGIVAGAAVAHRQAGPVRIVGLGPIITLAGAGITATALILLLVLGRRSAAARRAVRRVASTDSTASAEPVLPARSSRMELT